MCETTVWGDRHCYTAWTDVGTNDRADLDPNNVLASERNADLFGDLIGAFRRIDVGLPRRHHHLPPLPQPRRSPITAPTLCSAFVPSPAIPRDHHGTPRIGLTPQCRPDGGRRLSDPPATLEVLEAVDVEVGVRPASCDVIAAATSSARAPASASSAPVIHANRDPSPVCGYQSQLPEPATLRCKQRCLVRPLKAQQTSAR